jgi:hypothetical protein
VSTQQLQYVKFVIDETPHCLWDWNLKRHTLNFLDTVDPEYFGYIAEVHRESLSGDQQQRAALAIRTAYSQGLEALFAFLGATIQAPDCPHGWLARYWPHELRALTRKIQQHRAVLSRFDLKPVSWESISTAVHLFSLEDKEMETRIKRLFGQLWARFAGDFLNEKARQEYNGIKHGFRIKPGGFRLAVGLEAQPGVPAPPERMVTIGQSNFGSSFFIAERIYDNKIHFRMRRFSRNWNPENIVHGLHLISMSLSNIVSFLRHYNHGTGEMQFVWPEDEGLFDEPWKRSVGIAVMGHPELNIEEAPIEKYVEKFNKEEILSVYKRVRESKENLHSG